MSFAIANQTEKLQKNLCFQAINKNTYYKVTGIYGSPLESEWHPSAAYVLLKEIKKFLLLEKEYIEESGLWRFEIAELKGGKKIVFVYHKKIFKAYCNGPNAFFVIRK